jgi:hypothetical protein
MNAAEHVALHNEFRGIIIRWQLLTLPSAPRTKRVKTTGSACAAALVLQPTSAFKRTSSLELRAEVTTRAKDFFYPDPREISATKLHGGLIEAGAKKEPEGSWKTESRGWRARDRGAWRILSKSRNRAPRGPRRGPQGPMDTRSKSQTRYGIVSTARRLQMTRRRDEDFGGGRKNEEKGQDDSRPGEKHCRRAARVERATGSQGGFRGTIIWTAVIFH